MFEDYVIKGLFFPLALLSVSPGKAAKLLAEVPNVRKSAL
jgi:hypothetical protein